jgi:hypothetical protein
MTSKKTRIEIPSDMAAKVLFYSDRTCCVCRKPGKPIQIHHIDENPANNDFKNLAVLCLDCHNETMIVGGFGRKLNSEQIVLYRNDWLNKVAENRASYEMNLNKAEREQTTEYIQYITSITEIYKENEQYELLAMQYSSIGNEELRDKYIELALESNQSDETIIFLRSLQNKTELVPENVRERVCANLTNNKNWTQRARFYLDFNKKLEATKDYIRGILESLDNNNYFTAAFYLKELNEKNLGCHLFELALEEAVTQEDLWWQIRALEELGWHSEADELVLKNAQKIEELGDLSLLSKLESARGNLKKVLEIEKEIARESKLIVKVQEE